MPRQILCDSCKSHCSEVVPSSEVEMYGQLMEGGKQFVHCREVVLLS